MRANHEYFLTTLYGPALRETGSLFARNTAYQRTAKAKEHCLLFDYEGNS